MLLRAVHVVLLLAAASSARGDIIYNFDRNIGVNSFVGTITTDGTLGTLALSNIVDFSGNLIRGTVMRDVDLADLTAAGSDFGDLEATATEINVTSGWEIRRNGGTANRYFNNLAIERIYVQGSFQDTAYVGPFATASSSAAAVPEPSSVLLLGVASCGLAIVRRRRGRDVTKSTGA